MKITIEGENVTIVTDRRTAKGNLTDDLEMLMKTIYQAGRDRESWEYKDFDKLPYEEVKVEEQNTTLVTEVVEESTEEVAVEETELQEQS